MYKSTDEKRSPRDIHSRLNVAMRCSECTGGVVRFEKIRGRSSGKLYDAHLYLDPIQIIKPEDYINWSTCE